MWNRAVAVNHLFTVKYPNKIACENFEIQN